MSHRGCADVMYLAAFVRGNWRSALPQRGSQNERDAEAVAPLEGPSRSGGRGSRILSDLGKVPTDAVDQLGMQVPGGRAHAGAASYAPSRDRARGVRMRVVILCSSPYSETGCAVAARLAQLGYAPVGALTLPSWDRSTLSRKLGQWGLRDSLHYAVAKLAAGKATNQKQVLNPHLERYLRHADGVFRSLREVGRTHGFPIVSCGDQNSARAIAQLKQWSPDLAIFAGGSILRDEVLKILRLGVLNSHLALLPEIRGMSSPEWSLLCGVPLGITIHFMDSGIDTGPILLRREFAGANDRDSLADLRNKMIAEGIELIAEAVAGLDRGTIPAVPQADREKDFQFFVMHEQLKAVATRRLKKGRLNPVGDGCDGSGGSNG